MCSAGGLSFCPGLKQVFLPPHGHLIPALPRLQGEAVPLPILPAGGETNPGTLFPLLYISLRLVDGAGGYLGSNNSLLPENKTHSEVKNRSSSGICRKTILILTWHKPKEGLMK